MVSFFQNKVQWCRIQFYWCNYLVAYHLKFLFLVFFWGGRGMGFILFSPQTARLLLIQMRCFRLWISLNLLKDRPLCSESVHNQTWLVYEMIFHSLWWWYSKPESLDFICGVYYTVLQAQNRIWIVCGPPRAGPRSQSPEGVLTSSGVQDQCPLGSSNPSYCVCHAPSLHNM